MLSMSLGLMTLRSSTTLPSTNIKGLLDGCPLSSTRFEETPLILIVEDAPGDPELVVIFTPAT